MADGEMVSIVTPSFNQARFLEETIQSVLRQDYPRVEYIVIDGGSTDGSVGIIRGHENELAFWTSGPDRGQSHAINKGFARATGSILAWLNSDDVLAPSAVRIAVECLQRKAEVGLVYGDRIRIDSKGNVISFNRGPSYYASMLSRNITLPQETAFFRRHLFQAVGGLDETLQFAMDLDLWCKLARTTTFHHVPAFLGYFREHSESKSTCYQRACGGAGDADWREHERVFRHHFGKGLPPALRTRCYRLIHKTRFLIEHWTRSRVLESERISRLVHSGNEVAICH